MCRCLTEVEQGRIVASHECTTKKGLSMAALGIRAGFGMGCRRGRRNRPPQAAAPPRRRPKHHRHQNARRRNARGRLRPRRRRRRLLDSGRRRGSPLRDALHPARRRSASDTARGRTRRAHARVRDRTSRSRSPRPRATAMAAPSRMSSLMELGSRPLSSPRAKSVPPPILPALPAQGAAPAEAQARETRLANWRAGLSCARSR